MSPRSRRVRRGTLGTFVQGWLAFRTLAGALIALERRFIYFPDRTRPDPARAGAPDMAPVRLVTRDGLSLVAWYKPAAPGRATLVHFHGNAGNIAMRVPKMRPCMEAGYGVLLTAYRGYSGNPGRPSELGLYADGRAALDFLGAAGVAPERTALYGESLGTAVAVQLATERPAAGVILEAPFTSIVDVARRRYPFLPVERLLHERFDSLAKIADIRAPLLIVHGTRDAAVPAPLGRRLFAAAHEPKEAAFLPGAGHNDLYRHGAAEIVMDFLRRRVDAPAPGG